MSAEVERARDRMVLVVVVWAVWLGVLMAMAVMETPQPGEVPAPTSLAVPVLEEPAK